MGHKRGNKGGAPQKRTKLAETAHTPRDIPVYQYIQIPWWSLHNEPAAIFGSIPTPYNTLETEKLLGVTSHAQCYLRKLELPNMQRPHLIGFHSEEFTQTHSLLWMTNHVQLCP